MGKPSLYACIDTIKTQLSLTDVILLFTPLQHNQDRKHRTYVYTLIVTETLEDWEDSVNIGMTLT